MDGVVARPSEATSRMRVDQAAKNPRLDEATRELVGTVFYAALLKAQRAGRRKGRFGHGGRGEEVFGAQLDAALAAQAGRATKGGLAEALYQRLEKQQRRMDQRRQAASAGGAA